MAAAAAHLRRGTSQAATTAGSSAKMLMNLAAGGTGRRGRQARQQLWAGTPAVSKRSGSKQSCPPCTQGGRGSCNTSASPQPSPPT